MHSAIDIANASGYYIAFFRPPCWKVVENDPIGLEFAGERQGLPPAVTQASAQQ
jgi:hypothetical protein